MSVSATITIPERTLKDIRRVLSPARQRVALKRVGALALHDARKDFREASEPADTRWPALGNVTVILRKGGPRIHDEADIKQKRAGLKKLRDTNELYMSLSEGRPGNVFRVDRRGVRVGTSLKRAQVHQTGGRVAFTWTAREEKRLERNLSATKRGFRRPRRRKDGKRRQWKAAGKESPWSELFFRTRGGLRKMRGRSYKVPKRVIVRKPGAQREARYAAEVERFCAAEIRRAGG